MGYLVIPAGLEAVTILGFRLRDDLGGVVGWVGRFGLVLGFVPTSVLAATC